MTSTSMLTCGRRGSMLAHIGLEMPTKSRAVKLSTEEREVIRRHASARRSEAPARKASRHYSVGDEVETTEIIETFPETVYREAPSVRPYRYFRRDNSVILVDRGRTVGHRGGDHQISQSCRKCPACVTNIRAS